MTKQTQGAVAGVAWTPSDTGPRIAGEARGFQVGVEGDVTLEYPDGSTCTWPACAAGIIHPHVGFVRIHATGTTATGIVVAF